LSCWACLNRPGCFPSFPGRVLNPCERLRSHDAGGEVIPEEGLDAAWRVYLAMPALSLAGHEAGRFARASSVDQSGNWSSPIGIVSAGGGWEPVGAARCARAIAGSPVIPLHLAVLPGRA
jgi:hypothetical protein